MTYLETVSEDIRQADTPRLAGVVLNRSAVKALPDPEPLIDDVLDRGTTARPYGKWGRASRSSRSTGPPALRPGAIGTAAPPLRHARCTSQQKTLGLEARLDAWEVGWQRAIADDQLDVLPHAVNLMHAVQTGELRALIEWNGYGLVIVDTLSRCMLGADENSAKDCGVVVDTLTRIRESTPNGHGVVLGVHHAGKDGKTFRGSSVFEAGADTVYSTVTAVPMNENGDGVDAFGGAARGFCVGRQSVCRRSE